MPIPDPDMVHANCHKCSQTIYTHVDNLRAPYYCLACKQCYTQSSSSGSYNGRRAVSETDNVGPIPTPEAYCYTLDMKPFLIIMLGLFIFLNYMAYLQQIRMSG